MSTSHHLRLAPGEMTGWCDASGKPGTVAQRICIGRLSEPPLGQASGEERLGAQRRRELLARDAHLAHDPGSNLDHHGG